MYYERLSRVFVVFGLTVNERIPSVNSGTRTCVKIERNRGPSGRQCWHDAAMNGTLHRLCRYAIGLRRHGEEQPPEPEQHQVRMTPITPIARRNLSGQRLRPCHDLFVRGVSGCSPLRGSSPADETPSSVVCLPLTCPLIVADRLRPVDCGLRCSLGGFYSRHSSESWNPGIPHIQVSCPSCESMRKNHLERNAAVDCSPVDCSQSNPGCSRKA